jgi:hypothetical protein
VSPSLLSFENSPDGWTTERTLILFNISAQQLFVTASIIFPVTYYEASTNSVSSLDTEGVFKIISKKKGVIKLAPHSGAHLKVQHCPNAQSLYRGRDEATLVLQVIPIPEDQQEPTFQSELVSVSKSVKLEANAVKGGIKFPDNLRSLLRFVGSKGEPSFLKKDMILQNIGKLWRYFYRMKTVIAEIVLEILLHYCSRRSQYRSSIVTHL